ncbi:MAG: response regulator transcription factor [Lachnospiraceae bacterium]|nr:response regulator transcription factor [Lachnospiraceae bacterium]MBR5945109.1 response regulator transcription factor [Lachnospiraceae bacterium]
MRVLIVDDDALVCSSLKIILEKDPEITVVGIGNNGEDAVGLYNYLSPDVLLMDIRMDKMLGTEAAKEILKDYPEAKILFLTTFSDDEYIHTALNCGAKGYLLKQDYDSIIPALKAVASGQTVFGGKIMERLPNLLGKEIHGFKGEEFGLNEKECQIIGCIAEGLSNKEISEELFLSEGTVRNYISSILEKLALRDRTQIAVFYYKNK